MTEHDDDLTTKLTRSLTDRSDVMSGTSFGLAEVKDELARSGAGGWRPRSSVRRPPWP
jgi:hypothetical protein